MPLPARPGGQVPARSTTPWPQRATTILVFSDAATLFAPDAVRRARPPLRRRARRRVCGALEFEATPSPARPRACTGRYETMLRLMESRLGITLTASGAIYALRRRATRPSPPTR